MVRNDSAKEYLSPRETGNTKQELDWLKKIIGDKDKKQTVDNINFEEKFKDKNLDNNVSDKIKSLDVLADTLFDTYMIEKQNIIKDILNGQSSIEEKRTAIKEQFTGFIQNIQDPEKIKQYENNKDLSNAINTFNTVFEAFKEKLYTESQTTIELSQLELNHLKDEVLGSVSSSTSQYTNMGNNYKSYNPYHGVNYTNNSYNSDDYTEQLDLNDKNNGEIFKNIDQELTNHDNISKTNNYNPINDIILYKGSNYLEWNEDEGDLPENTPDKRALKKLLSGKDKNLIIVDQKFKPTDGEKKLLKELNENIKNIGLDTFSDEIRYVKGLYFKNNGKVDRKDEDKNIGELGTLYSSAMEQSNDYPYFSKVLLILTEEFIDNPNTTFVDIYNKYNSVPNRKELGLANENRNMLQRTFNSHNKAFNILGNIDRSLETPEAKELIKRTKKLDINKTIEDNMRRVEKSRLEGYEDEAMKGKGKESDFISFLVKQLEPTVFNDEKKNHLYEVLSGQYSFELSPSQESFLHLLNATRLGMSVEQYVNTKLVSKKIETTNVVEEKNDIFASRLFDLNSDGRLDFGDGSVRTGLQLRSYYDAATIEIGEDKVLSNLIDTAKTFANSKNFKNYDVILDAINGQNTTEAKLDRLLDEFRDPGFIKFLQMVLLESPLDPNLIFTQGNEAFKHYSEMLDELNEEDKKLIHSHINEQLKDYDVNPIIKEGIFQSLATPLIQAKQQGLGAGIFVSLDNILKGLSINVGTGFVDNTPSVLGVHIARNKNFALNENTAIYTGTSLGTVNGFIPVASIGGGVEKWITNKGKRTLDTSSAQKVALGPNITLIGGVVPSFGISAGFGVDKMKGIEEQTQYIRKGVTPIIQEFLKNYELIDGTKPESIKLLKRIIKKQFGDSDPETLEKAANNIYTALTYFGFTDSDREILQNNIGHFSSLLADFYVTNRTNEQMMGLDRWHFSSASLGVQFLAGYYPIPTVCVQIAKYKNIYYKDTPESIRQNDIAETTGFGNEFKEFANHQEVVDYLNKALPVENNKITLSPDGKYFIIPNALYQRQSININIDPDLKSYLKETEDKKAIQVPVATQLRYMLRNQGANAIYILNIGDIKTEKNDLHLRIARSVPKDWFGDKELEEIETTKSETITNIEKITNPFESELNKISSILQKLDTIGKLGEITEFEQFLGDGISSNNTNNSSNKLINLLKKIPNYKNNSDITKLVNTLSFGTDLEKTFIIDHVKSIFAYNKDFTSHEIITKTMKSRSSWKTISGISGETAQQLGIDSIFDKYKQDLGKKVFDELYISKEEPIFGYTAWYRKNADDIAKNWSMTLPGHTNILQAENNIYAKKIENDPNDQNDNKLGKIRNWFLKNFEKDIHEQTILKNTLTSMIKNNPQYNYLPQDIFDNINSNEIEKLLLGEELTIDIGNKIYNINLINDWVFYLLQECANESVGFIPKEIKITEKTKKSIGLRTNTTGTINRADMAQKKTREAGFTFAKEKPREEGLNVVINEEEMTNIRDNGDGTYTYTDINGNDIVFTPETEFVDRLNNLINGETEDIFMPGGAEPIKATVYEKYIQDGSFSAGVGGGSEDQREKEKNKK